MNNACIENKTYLIPHIKIGQEMEEIVDYLRNINNKSLGMEIAVAFEEAFVNIATYAYKEGGPVFITILKTPSKIEIVMDDCGKPYDPTKVKTSKITNEYQIGGQGLFLMQTYSNLSYKRTFGHNMLRLTKTLE